MKQDIPINELKNTYDVEVRLLKLLKKQEDLKKQVNSVKQDQKILTEELKVVVNDISSGTELLKTLEKSDVTKMSVLPTRDDQKEA